MMTLWYRALSKRSNSLPIPQPDGGDQRLGPRRSRASCRGEPFRRSGSFRESAGSPWVSRDRPCLAVPPAESPSTMKSLGNLPMDRAAWQSASLPGQAMVGERPFAPSQVSRLAGRGPGAGGVDDLGHEDRLGHPRVLLEVVAQLLVEDALPPARAPHSFRASSSFGPRTPVGRA